MKTLSFILALICLPTAARVLGQGFINLGFNEPDLSGLPPRTKGGDPLTASTKDLLRGWTLTADGVPRESADYWFWGSVGSGPGINLVDSAILGSPNDGRGSYYLYVHTFRIPQDRIGLDVRLSQRGAVPTDAKELQFISTLPVEVWINDRQVEAAGVYYNSVPVHEFAGQEVNIEFRFWRNSGIEFDVIGFVPEPEIPALLGVGGLALACAWLRHRGRSNP